MNISASFQPVRTDLAAIPSGQVPTAAPAFETLLGQANAAVAGQPVAMDARAPDVALVSPPPALAAPMPGEADPLLDTPLPTMMNIDSKRSTAPELAKQPVTAQSFLPSKPSAAKGFVEAENAKPQGDVSTDDELQHAIVAQPSTQPPQFAQTPAALAITTAGAAPDGSVEDNGDTEFLSIATTQSRLKAPEQPKPQPMGLQASEQVQQLSAVPSAKPVKALERKEPTVISTVEAQAKSQPLQLADIPALQQPAPISSAVVTTQPLATPESLPTAHLDLSQDTVWIDQLAREIVAVASNDGKLRFSLSPEGLGQLDVAIQTQKDGVEVRLQPSNEAAARIFAAEQPKLVDELRQSGVRVMNSDLMSGHQTNSHREQSQPQYSAQQVPVRSFAQASANSLPAKKPHNERFA